MTGQDRSAGALGSDPPLVSVMTVSYNQRPFVADAIESALTQDYPNLEIVIADDASSDGTAEVIQDYARRYPGKVRPIFQPSNVGISANCNAALARCTGKYVAFLAGDDLFLPGKISAQVAWLEEREERVLCGHQVEVFYDDGSGPAHPLTRRMAQGRGPEQFLTEEPFGAIAMMVRADRIPERGFDETLPIMSDQLLWVEVLAGGGEFGYVPGTLARYRRHSANVTNDSLAYVADVERYLHIVEQRYPQYAASCRHAFVRQALYDVGVKLMKAGRRREARARFLQAIRREPLFTRPWVRLAQSFL